MGSPLIERCSAAWLFYVSLKTKPGPASVVPFVARSLTGEDVTEALLRPRMPVVENFSSAVQEEDPHQHPDGGGNQEFVRPDESNADLLTLLKDLPARNGDVEPAQEAVRVGTTDH